MSSGTTKSAAKRAAKAAKGRTMERFFIGLLRRRALVLVAFALLSACAVAVCSRAKVGSSLGRLFLGESPEYQRWIERADIFGSNDAFVIGFDAADLATTGRLAMLRDATAAVAQIQDVRSVQSVLDSSRVHAIEEGEGRRLRADTLIGSACREAVLRHRTCGEGTAQVPLVEATASDDRLREVFRDPLRAAGIDAMTAGLPDRLRAALDRSTVLPDDEGFAQDVDEIGFGGDGGLRSEDSAAGESAGSGGGDDLDLGAPAAVTGAVKGAAAGAALSGAVGPPDSCAPRRLTLIDCDDAKVKTFLDELRTDPYVGGVLLSKDGLAALVVVELIVDADRPAERAPEVVRASLDAFAAAGFERSGLRVGGMPATVGEVVDETLRNLVLLFPITTVLLLVSVWLLFGRFLPVLISQAVALLGVLWTMAFSIALDPYISVLLSMVPPVILIVSFSDVIHFLSAYAEELRKGRPKREAIIASASDVGTACLLTSATTFVGFVALSLVPTPAFRQLGLVLGFGVAATLLIALVLVPVILDILPPPDLPPAGSRAADRLVDAILKRCRRLARGRPYAVIGAFSLGLLLSFAGLSQLTIETDFEQRLAADNPVRMDGDWLAEHFAGTNLIELYVTAPAAGGALDPALLTAVAAAQRQIEALPGVDASVSIADLVREVRATLDGVPAADVSLPTDGAGVAQAMLIYELSGTSELRQLIDFDQRVLRIPVRVSEGGMRASWQLGEDIGALARAAIGGLAQTEISGLSWMLGGWLDSILAGQRNGVALSFGLITVMMAFGLRSVRNGLLSMIPNALPLVGVGAIAAVVWERLDSDALAVAMLAIGIGVDDTIHFLMRCRLEAHRDAEIGGVIDRTFAFAGRAILMTTFILVIGFLPFAASGYLPLRMFGTLLPLALVLAWIADVLLVPALVQVGVLRFEGADGQAPTR